MPYAESRSCHWGAEAKLTAYLHHRQERENRILDAVKNTDGSLTSVVDHAYHDTPVILRSGWRRLGRSVCVSPSH